MLLALVRRPAGEDLEQDRPQPVDVGPRVDQVEPPLGLLRRHVRRRPELPPRLRRLAPRLGRHAHLGQRLVGLVGPVDDLGQAPVEDDHLAEAPQHDVLRLQVAVHHPARVRIADRLADRHERLQQPQPLQRVDLPPPRSSWCSAIAWRRVRPWTNRMV